MNKKSIRILLLAIACVILCISLIACNGDDAENKASTEVPKNSEPAGSDDESNNGSENSSTNNSGGESNSNSENNESQGGSENEENKTPVNEPSFSVFSGGEYTCTIVLPKKATDIDKKVASIIQNVLSEKTGKEISVVNQGGAGIDTKGNLVLVGKTAYADSNMVYKDLADRTAKIGVKKNRIVVAFQNESSGVKVAETLAETIKKCENNEIAVKLSFTSEYTSLAEKQDFVQYTGGEVEVLDYEDGTILYTSYGNQIKDFDDYCAELKNAGYESVTERVIAGNSFNAFKGETEYVYAYYVKESQTSEYVQSTNKYLIYRNDVSGVIKIARGPLDKFIDEDLSSGKSATVTPKLANIPNPEPNDWAVGQGYIFVLPDGRLIVQDSGVKSNKDYVYEAIKSVAPDPNNIVIAAWFISHQHDDHQDGLIQFVQRHGSDETVTIERIIINYTKLSLYDCIRYDVEFVNGQPRVENGDEGVQLFYDTMEKYVPDVPLVTAHTGQIFDFGNNVTVEVLFTVEDLVPDEIEDSNNCSMVIRVNIAGQKTLILGDMGHKPTQMFIKMWGDHVKSDIVQIAHHGLWTADYGLYELVGAKVLLWPTNAINIGWCMSQDTTKKVVNDLITDLYISDTTVWTIDLPYVIKNNKAAELARLNATT